MKLPDFANDSALNELRRKMNAEFRAYVPAPSRTTVTSEELEALTTKGIEIPLRDVDVLNDGTFTYKGRRVVVYIRDLTSYRDEYKMPRFHLAMCETLLTMKNEGRYEKRYVVAAREDGLFTIQKIKDNRVVSSTDEELAVCQNCLHGLHYKNFNRNKRHESKEKFIKNFSINTFFEEFGRSTVWAVPHYDSVHAPTNIYSVDFYKTAKAVKERRGYICEDPRCRRDLSKQIHQKFLHAHHIDADKSDNRSSNIKLLCIHCHAKAFNHSQLRGTKDYKEYCKLFDLAQ